MGCLCVASCCRVAQGHTTANGYSWRRVTAAVLCECDPPKVRRPKLKPHHRPPALSCAARIAARALIGFQFPRTELQQARCRRALRFALRPGHRLTHRRRVPTHHHHRNDAARIAHCISQLSHSTSPQYARQHIALHLLSQRPRLSVTRSWHVHVPSCHPSPYRPFPTWNAHHLRPPMVPVPPQHTSFREDLGNECNKDWWCWSHSQRLLLRAPNCLTARPAPACPCHFQNQAAAVAR